MTEKKKSEKGIFGRGALFILSLLVCALFAGNALADFTVPPKPDNGWYIADTAGALSTPDKAILNHKLDTINKKSRNEIGIAIVPTLDGSSIEDAAQDTFHQWGIGKAGLDNGVLILIATKDRKIRIQTGNGAEGDLPDSVCNQIILDSKPFYRKGDWAGGLSYDIDQLSSKMESRVGQTPIVPPTKANPTDTDSSMGWGLLIFFGIIGVIGLFMWRATRKARKWHYMSHSYNTPSYSGPATPQHYSVPDPHHVASKRTVGLRPVAPPVSPIVPVAAAAVGAGVALTLAERRKRQAQADADRAARDRDRKAEESRKKSNDDDDSSSSGGYYSSSSSSDSWGGGGGGGDFGGGFGGGDSGGGGASGDF